MPTIRAILLNLEGFQYYTSLELNMGYYHISLREEASNICAIILHFINSECNCNSTIKAKGTCYYIGECRQRCVVYKATCRLEPWYH